MRPCCAINGSKEDPRSFDTLDASFPPGLPPGALEDRVRGDQLPPLLRRQRAGGPAGGSPRGVRRRHQRSLELSARRASPDCASTTWTAFRIRRDTWNGCRFRWDARRAYIVVEKILGARANGLPHEWPVAGTTGYEFLNALNGIFVHPQRACRRSRDYARCTGAAGSRSRRSAMPPTSR